MFFRILIKYILGYINIKIEGYFVEKFIHKCINENIFFWNSVRPGVVGVRRKFLPSGRLMNGLKIVWCLSPFI